jgi:hypothetical protein
LPLLVLFPNALVRLETPPSPPLFSTARTPIRGH